MHSMDSRRPFELLSPAEMAEADRRAIAAGPFDGLALMRRAGAAVADTVLSRFASASAVHVLCGPGNNGGDGYVVAGLLRASGVAVSVFADGLPRAGSDAALAARDSGTWPRPLAEFDPQPGSMVVDALYGAGLARPLDGPALAAIERARKAGIPVVAVDLPSGVSGASGLILGDAFAAAVTVTFARLKPGHLLYPGRKACGEVVLADIGIADALIASLGVKTFENTPTLWGGCLPTPAEDAHKYSRGHVMVLSGGATATGAARLSAMAAARSGAGAVTLLSPSDALAANAAHLTSIMLRPADTLNDMLAAFAARPPAALVYGPGLAPEVDTAGQLFRLLDLARPCPPVVVDAGALTAIGHSPDLLTPPFGGRSSDLVLTPHEGEFARVFPDLARQAVPSKLERARRAAARAEVVLVYKGPDTVVAAPDGRAAINTNGTPLLATAGSGDVLSGIIAGLLAQGMPAFEAACAAVWIHAEAARQFGPGLIAEDLPLAIGPVIRQLLTGSESWDA